MKKKTNFCVRNAKCLCSTACDHVVDHGEFMTAAAANVSAEREGGQVAFERAYTENDALYLLQRVERTKKSLALRWSS